MKNYIIPIAVLLLLLGCNNKAEQPTTGEDSLEAEANYSWEATLNDSSGRLEMKKLEASGPDSLTPSAVIRFINNNYPNIKLEMVKTSGDTIYLRIPEATYLTQQMGSSGPTMYFAMAVYNLTEIPGIRFANFDFEEGDHAQPDTFTRENFKDE